MEESLRRIVAGSLSALALCTIGLTGCGEPAREGVAAPVEEVTTTGESFGSTVSLPSTGAPTTGANKPVTITPSSTVALEVSPTFDSASSEAEIRAALALRDDQVIGTGAIFGDPFKDAALTTVLDIREAAGSTEPGRMDEGRHTLVVATGSSKDTKWAVTSTLDVELVDFQILSLSHEACRIGDQPTNEVVAILSPEFKDGTPVLGSERWSSVRAWRVSEGKLVEIDDAKSVSCELAGE